MIVWRICRRPYAGGALSGRGGLVAGGRWHTAPRRVVYTSGSLSLASLEVLVHADKDLLPSDYVAIAAEIPRNVNITEIAATKLPKDWRQLPAPPSLSVIGDRWLDGKSSAVLRAPSAVIPLEHNYLINPNHKDASRIVMKRSSAFAFDPRVLKR